MTGILSEAALGLFSICAAIAAMDLLIPDGGISPAFRAVCATATATCALRLIARLLGI